MQCPNCSAMAPENARFCPQCGLMLVSPEPEAEGSSAEASGWSTFFMMLALSLGLSYLLTAVFNMPIFILGTILPFFWLGRRNKSI
jgi:hypothetical protein